MATFGPEEVRRWLEEGRKKRHEGPRPMRDEAEILDVLARLGEDRERATGKPLAGALRDTFRDGYLAGKIAALAWVLGDPGYVIGQDLDYGDWVKGLLDGGPIDLAGE
jgi:hypothetical protein